MGVKSPHRIILRPLTTEKAYLDQNLPKKVYTFEVDVSANKIQIREAVEEIFQVSVLKVNTIAYKGKKRRLRRVEGKRRDWKKAMVTLKKGEIELM